MPDRDRINPISLHMRARYSDQPSCQRTKYVAHITNKDKKREGEKGGVVWVVPDPVPDPDTD